MIVQARNGKLVIGHVNHGKLLTDPITDNGEKIMTEHKTTESKIDDLLKTQNTKANTIEYTTSDIGDMLNQLITSVNKLVANDDTDFTEVEETEEETPEMEMMEYKNDFYQMSVGSLRAIMQHSQAILAALENPSVKENLTESWLQGKIAITEDYMRTIHDFVMFVSEGNDNTLGGSKPGLWENIRKKKEKMGKKYKPAKPGDKDRPDPDAWKKAQK